MLNTSLIPGCCDDPQEYSFISHPMIQQYLTRDGRTLRLRKIGDVLYLLLLHDAASHMTVYLSRLVSSIE